MSPKARRIRARGFKPLQLIVSRRPETLIDKSLLLNITGIASGIFSNLLDVSNEFMKDVGQFLVLEVQLQLGDLKEGTDFNSRSDVDLFINVPPEIFDRIPLERRDRDASFTNLSKENQSMNLGWMRICVVEFKMRD